MLPIAAGDSAEAQAEEYMARFTPAMLISIEKLGPNPEGIACSSTGTPSTEQRGRAEYMFDLAKARGIPTLGIGDNGNEIGFGLIIDAVRQYKPRGEKLATRRPSVGAAAKGEVWRIATEAVSLAARLYTVS